MIKKFKKMGRDLVIILLFSSLIIFWIYAQVISPFKVDGISMETTLKNNDRVVVFKLTNNYNIGDIIVFTNPNNKLSIKRITKIIDDLIFVEGDNKLFSVDSRNFGTIEKSSIVGKVIFKYFPEIKRF